MTAVTISTQFTFKYIHTSATHKFLLHHLPEHGVYLVLSTAEITTINKVGVLLVPATIWCVQLKVPEKV